MAVAEFRLCVGHDCLGAHLHHIAIRPDPHCKLRSHHEPMDRSRLGQRTALSDGTECERYWEARTKMMENWLCYFIITIFLWLPLSIRTLYVPWMFLVSVFCFCFLKCIFLWLPLSIRTLYVSGMFLVSVFCFCFLKCIFLWLPLALGLYMYPECFLFLCFVFVF